VYARVSPKPAQEGPGGARNAKAFYGVGAWALSALPECWQQQTKATGNVVYVRAHLPPGSLLLNAGERIAANDCTLTVGARDATVTRAADTLHLPAPTQVYRSSDRLSILHLQGNSAELRTYTQTP